MTYLGALCKVYRYINFVLCLTKVILASNVKIRISRLSKWLLATWLLRNGQNLFLSDK